MTLSERETLVKVRYDPLKERNWVPHERLRSHSAHAPWHLWSTEVLAVTDTDTVVVSRWSTKVRWPNVMCAATVSVIPIVMCAATVSVTRFAVRRAAVSESAVQHSRAPWSVSTAAAVVERSAAVCRVSDGPPVEYKSTDEKD